MKLSPALEKLYSVIVELDHNNKPLFRIRNGRGKGYTWIARGAAHQHNVRISAPQVERLVKLGLVLAIRSERSSITTYKPNYKTN